MITGSIVENDLRAAELPAHAHEFVTPIFTERKSDAHLILSGLMCECQEEIDLDF